MMEKRLHANATVQKITKTTKPIYTYLNRIYTVLGWKTEVLDARRVEIVGVLRYSRCRIEEMKREDGEVNRIDTGAHRTDWGPYVVHLTRRGACGWGAGEPSRSIWASRTDTAPRAGVWD